MICYSFIYLIDESNHFVVNFYAQFDNDLNNLS